MQPDDWLSNAGIEYQAIRIVKHLPSIIIASILENHPERIIDH